MDGLQLVKRCKIFHSSLILISRFWISEAAISARDMTGEEQTRYYLSFVSNLLMLSAGTKAKTEIRHFWHRCKKKISVANAFGNSGQPKSFQNEVIFSFSGSGSCIAFVQGRFALMPWRQ